MVDVPVVTSRHSGFRIMECLDISANIFVAIAIRFIAFTEFREAYYSHVHMISEHSPGVFLERYLKSFMCNTLVTSDTDLVAMIIKTVGRHIAYEITTYFEWVRKYLSEFY